MRWQAVGQGKGGTLVAQHVVQSLCCPIVGRFFPAGSEYTSVGRFVTNSGKDITRSKCLSESKCPWSASPQLSNYNTTKIQVLVHVQHDVHVPMSVPARQELYGELQDPGPQLQQ